MLQFTVPEAQWAVALVGFVPSYPWLAKLEMPSVVGKKTNCSVGRWTNQHVN
jgi:hypothetical protein